LRRTTKLLSTVLTAGLGLAACGGGGATAPSTSPASVAPASPSTGAASTAASAKPVASTAASAKPAASGATAASASAKPAASGATAASGKPAASGAAATAKPAASGAEAAAPPAAARTPVVEVAKVPPGPPTPQVAALASAPPSARPPLAASYSQPVGPYSLYLETIASAAPSTAGLLSVPGCVVESIFKRGERVVFRYSIIDMSTGKRVTDRDGSTTKVTVGNNQTVDGYFAPRGAPPPPPDAPWTWAAIWNIPADFPLGNISPTIDVTSGGKSTTIKASDFAALPVQIVD